MNRLAAVLALSLAAAPAARAADAYVIDPSHTFANFAYNHLGFSTASGRFNTTSGSIVLDLARKSGSVDVTIDANSVNTGVPKFDDHLRSPDFLDTAKFPAITFKSTSFRFKGDQLAEVTGDLTLHGVTRPVTLSVTAFACKDHPIKKVPTCGADATATIKRSDFGVDRFAPHVGDELRLTISVEAQRKS